MQPTIKKNVARVILWQRLKYRFAKWRDYAPLT